MATVRDIKRRIKSVKNTQQITKAMKMVSAAKLRKNQNKLTKIREYVNYIESIYKDLSLYLDDDNPFVKVKGEKFLFVIITGDRGLCGSFNHNIIKEAEKFLKENRDQDIELVCIGKKGYQYFSKEGYNIKDYYIDIADRISKEKASEIINTIGISRFLRGEIGKIHIIYDKFINPIKYEIINQKILPLDFNPVLKNEEYIIEPTVEAVLNKTIETKIVAHFLLMIVETYCSELGARMTSMDNATKNADDMIEDLILTYNKARQASITKEIADIVGGAEAMRKRER